MTDYWVSGANLTSVADAIRAKTSTSAPLVFPSGFVSAINGISAPYYEIYKVFFNRDVIYASGRNYNGISYTSSDIVDWCKSLSKINTEQFAGVQWSGSFTFTNVSQIREYGFARPYINGQTGGAGPTTFSFPSCTSMSDAAFARNAYGIQSVYFPILSSIAKFAFAYCYSLTTISFPSCTYIDNYAFEYCDSLTTASFPVCTSTGNSVFAYCDSLTTLSFPNCTRIGFATFVYCSSLTTVNFPKCTSIGDYAFSNCFSLTTLSFPSCTFIGNYAFSNCSSLTTASFPVCTSTGNYAFANCSKLTTANFPVCTSIGSYAFRSCYNLISLYLNNVSTITVLGNNAFSSTPIGEYSTSAGQYGSVFVPSSLYNSFITATNWASVSSRIVSV